jgi:hypothetical protein
MSSNPRAVLGAERGGRPRWLLFFTVLLLIAGGNLFFGSLFDLHRVLTGKPEVLHFDGSFNEQKETLLRAQVVLGNVLAQTKPVLYSLHAVMELALALIYLFAVAAIFSNDPRGRRVGLLAAWAGFVTCVGHAGFLLGVVQRIQPWFVPMLATSYAQDATRAGRALPAPDVVAEQARLFLVDAPLLATAMGMVFSLLLLAYFAGRRMRLFYNQPRRVDDG